MRKVGWLRKLFGDGGERTAVQYLKRRGYRILARQMRNRVGEIDIIAAIDDWIVFIEVKTRQSAAKGHPSEAVTREKQRQIARTALAWLKQKGWLERRSRFDVIAITWQPDGEPTIEHFISAFEAAGTDGLYG